jgi:hypothetical protein
MTARRKPRGSWPTRKKLDPQGRMVRTFAAKSGGPNAVSISLVGGRHPFLRLNRNGNLSGLIFNRRTLRTIADGLYRMLDSKDGNP